MNMTSFIPLVCFSPNELVNLQCVKPCDRDALHMKPHLPLTSRTTETFSWSPTALSWMPTLLTSVCSGPSPMGVPRPCAAQDGCSFCGSRSGRGPRLLGALQSSSAARKADSEIEEHLLNAYEQLRAATGCFTAVISHKLK